MQWKFQHEDHNRQEKALKPDYREELQANRDPNPKRTLDTFKWHMDFKAELIRRFEQGVFIFGGRRLRLGCSLKNYAESNGLREGVNKLYKPHREAALKDLKAITKAIQVADSVWGISVKGNQQPQLKFRISLHCDYVAPLQVENDDILPQEISKARPFFSTSGFFGS